MGAQLHDRRADSVILWLARGQICVVQIRRMITRLHPYSPSIIFELYQDSLSSLPLIEVMDNFRMREGVTNCYQGLELV